MFSRLCIVRSNGGEYIASGTMSHNRRDTLWHDQSSKCDLCERFASVKLPLNFKHNIAQNVKSANTVAYVDHLLRVWQRRHLFDELRYNDSLQPCCLRYCTSRFVASNQWIFYETLLDDWKRNGGAVVDLDTRLHWIDADATQRWRLTNSSHCTIVVSMANETPSTLQSCLMCTRALKKCVCHCHRTLWSRLRGRKRSDLMPRGMLTDNVLLRAYTFVDPRSRRVYRAQLIRHLARLGFAATNCNVVQCSGCLFAVSYWDMHCLFLNVGVYQSSRLYVRTAVRDAANGLRMKLHSRRRRCRPRDCICHRNSSNDDGDDVCLACVRDEMFPGLRELTVWCHVPGVLVPTGFDCR